MTHPRLNFAGLLAELTTTLLEIYESKHWVYRSKSLPGCRDLKDLYDLTSNRLVEILPDIMKLYDAGYTIYITADHGNVYSHAWRTLNAQEKAMLYTNESRGGRPSRHRHRWSCKGTNIFRHYRFRRLNLVTGRGSNKKRLCYFEVCSRVAKV